MSTPYWGQLPPPQGRRLSESSDQTDRRQSLDQSSLPQPRYSSNRASRQTNITDAHSDSTFSPLASPTTSNAPGSGLTPRPPSLPYTQDQQPQQISDFRRRQTIRNPSENTYEVANTSPPPAVPDVPRGPPINYGNIYGNRGSPYAGNPADQHSLSRSFHGLESQTNAVNMEPETFYKDVTPPAERQSRQPAYDRAYQNFNDGVVSPEHLERELVRSGSIRRPPNGYRPDRRDPASPKRRESLGPEPQQTMWAADRSPLQKLELTLDSITKEEKRARVEAAERRARERAAQVSKSTAAVEKNQPLPERQASQQTQARSKDLSVGGGRSRHRGTADSAQAMPATDIAYGTLSQSPPEVVQQHEIPGQSPRSQIPISKNRSVSAATNGTPQRNLSFRERAATQERGFPQEPNEVVNSVAQVAARGENAAPVRSGSNKLKKNPPGDPWYTARREAEERSAERSATYNRLNATDSNNYAGAQSPSHDTSYAAARLAGGMAQDRSSPINNPRPPARGKTFGEDRAAEEPPSRIKELAAAIGFGRSNSMEADRQPYSSTSKNMPILSGRNMQHNTLDGPMSHQQEPATSGELSSATSLNQNRHNTALAKAFQGTQPGDRGTKSVKFQDGGQEPGVSNDHLSDATHSRHHVREYLHHHDGLKPGQGTYRAPVYSDEWKQGAVGLLSGPLLDLSQEPVQTLDKSTAWWEAGNKRRPSISTQPPKRTFDGGNDDDETRTAFKPPIYLKCGPLLRYCGIRVEEMHARMSRDNLPSNKEIWRGSVMIVTQDSGSTYNPAPILRLFVQPIELLPPPPAELKGEQPLLPEYVDPIAGIPKVGNHGETLYVRPVDQLEEAKDLSMVEPDDGLFELVRSPPDDGTPDPPGSFPNRKRRIEVDGEKLGKFKDVRGSRLHAERGHTFWRFNIEIELRDKQQRIAYRINGGPATGFWVPARGESMNIMFYSCNGFSQSVNPDDFSGPDPMWRDVLNDHQTRPFHVMIGGGDQIYNDAVTNKAKLFSEWITLKNPLHKSNAPFTPALQDELEAFYLERYMMWFSQGLFGLASSQIPMVNMYDDHDIIDGFGSYPHHFMKSPVFSGLGNVAFKYYLLFQHQSIPDETDDEPSWCLGVKPGPYINHLSRSLFVSLGARVALLAVDARTERTREEILHPDTWRKLMDRCYEEVVKGKTQHLLVLLGVPIAYPRLVWLENILTSRLMDPVKALGKFGLLGNLVNSFDGGIEVLDDLDDHWTAKNHKDERRFVIEDLQDLAVDKSVRITILSGDVHLAAVGQFYSNPKLRIPKHEDFRYMLNVISSAIANTPPPDLMADVLNKRNKVHHFDKETDEDMMPLFAHGVDGKPRNNKHLLPHRNWCSIREYVPGHTPPPEEFEITPEVSPPGSRGGLFRRLSLSKDRGPAYRPDIPGEPTDRSRPPLSGGFMRSFSRRGSVSGEIGRPESNGLKRTLSLGSRPRNLLRRKSKKGRPDDGGINGSWGDDDEDVFAAPGPSYFSHAGGNSLGLRGGAGSEYEIGDEAHFTARSPRRAFTQPLQSMMQPQQYYMTGSDDGGAPTRPFQRTPTGLSMKKLKKHGSERYEVNTEGSLEVCLNVEVSPKDPAGITVPYRLLVPRLWYEYQGEGSPAPELAVDSSLVKRMSHGQGPENDDGEQDVAEPPQKKPSGLRRWFSNRGKRNQQDVEDEWDEEYER
ncbi:hypothetical protein F5B22DRAFT_430114 [Xylaria bambusicola]|uniref:uncharacterized protein n=1 Tax=Xylaria bambusicola TaxID=326684 RepID=UPI0020088229|nr:uncharacterized protein F5B22DRAFT_430114 [Xylaria bambusicola]KAI0506946.1 hypothetical protein F5B22DRAFT_430114 [Xylaria bambusicola]